MIYKIETYDGLSYEISPQQYERLKAKIDTGKFIHLPSGKGTVTIAIASIKQIFQDYETEKERIEEKASDVAQLFGGSVVGYLTSGKIDNPDKKVILKMKRIWFEHIKRMPEIDKKMESLRKQAHEHWRRITGISKLDSRYKYPVFLTPPYTKEELKIINTPIEKLMEEFQSLPTT